jgi:hypothetical protein
MPLGLFEHALRLHQRFPDAVLPRDGEPYPDHERHRDRRSRTDPRLSGADVAAVLDAHFAAASAASAASPVRTPADLDGAFHELDVPIHRNPHIVAAALRADRQQVRETGRWLVRHGTDRCSVTVGLALLATDHAVEDIPLIQTIGLLSRYFGPLATDALSRRREGGPALVWLAQRAAGWGRVYMIEELCRSNSSTARPWLLRHACDGDHLNGYFAGQVATATHLHEAITSAATANAAADDELVDHTGRLLAIMADCNGMGLTLANYPPAPIVLAAHASHLARQTPGRDRFVHAATIADHLKRKDPERCGCTAEQRDRLVRDYRTVLDQPDWRSAARTELTPGNWFADNVAARLDLHPPTSLRDGKDPTTPGTVKADEL